MKSRPILILTAAFMAGMIAAIYVPRESSSSDFNWLLFMTVAVAAGAISTFLTHQRVDETV